jgi:DNA-binding CsgD family transcriptional regulator
MFDKIFEVLVGDSVSVEGRSEGVAFFKVSKTVYEHVSALSYLGINIPLATRRGRYMQCSYSDSSVKQCVRPVPLSVDRLTGIGSAEFVDFAKVEQVFCREGELATAVDPAKQALAMRLRPLRDEVALFGVCIDTSHADWPERKDVILRDFRILGNYFHQHILRIYGHDTESDMLVSARELDCLKWVAEGKTAWEASVILGISERTVRFHLNSAREKMRCATTTQAVAKAVAQRLIVV